MDLLKKIGTAFRGGSREVLEGVVDANSIRILTQEIHDADITVQSAKQNLCNVSAERIRLERESERLTQTLEEKEIQAVAALKDGNNKQAEKIAQWIADNEAISADLCKKHEQLEVHEADLKQGLLTVINQIEHYRRELRMVRATESAQSAVKKISSQENKFPKQLADVKSSLVRIREKQQNFSDKLAAAKSIESELSGYVLGDQLCDKKQMGSPDMAATVLKRLGDKAADDLKE